MTEDFQRLIEKNGNKIKRLARNYSFGNENNDLEQEIYLQIWRSYSSFSGQSSIDTWLYRIAINTAVSFQRHEIRERKGASTNEQMQTTFYTPDGLAAEEILSLFMRDLSTLDKLASASQNTRHYYQVLKRRFVIETVVSFVAILLVIAFMVFGDSLMAKVIFELSLSEHIRGLGNVNTLMMFSCILMIIYCVVTPVQLWRSIMPDESLSWSLADRVKSEIEKLTLQQHFWQKSPIWSFLPANIIGVSFFWGLQFSLLGTWAPSIYLLIYFALISVMTAGGFWLKKQMLQNEISPLMQELQMIERELVALGNE